MNAMGLSYAAAGVDYHRMDALPAGTWSTSQCQPRQNPKASRS
jgi:hypothetical protein